MIAQRIRRDLSCTGVVAALLMLGGCVEVPGYPAVSTGPTYGSAGTAYTYSTPGYAYAPAYAYSYAPAYAYQPAYAPPAVGFGAIFGGFGGYDFDRHHDGDWHRDDSWPRDGGSRHSDGHAGQDFNRGGVWHRSNPAAPGWSGSRPSPAAVAQPAGQGPLRLGTRGIPVPVAQPSMSAPRGGSGWQWQSR